MKPLFDNITTSSFAAKGVSYKDNWEKKFRLPVPNSKFPNPFLFFFIYFKENQSNIDPLLLTKMEIHARFVPKIGIGYGARDTDIFVKMLESEGLTKRAGIQEGDIIKSINGKTPKTIPEAIGMIREYEIGAEIPVVVERRNEQKEVAIQNDW